MTITRFRAMNVALTLTLALLMSIPAMASHHKSGPVKQAIVLAAFGTSYPTALILF